MNETNNRVTALTTLGSNVSYSKAQAKLEKLQTKMKAAREEVARQKAIAASRASTKARQCADIAFHLLRNHRPEVLVWVEEQLTREQDKMTFVEWRAMPGAQIAADATPVKGAHDASKS